MHIAPFRIALQLYVIIPPCAITSVPDIPLHNLNSLERRACLFIALAAIFSFYLATYHTMLLPSFVSHNPFAANVILTTYGVVEKQLFDFISMVNRLKW